MPKQMCRAWSSQRRLPRCPPGHALIILVQQKPRLSPSTEDMLHQVARFPHFRAGEQFTQSLLRSEN